MVLGSGVEVLFSAWNWRRNALNLAAKIPPCLVELAEAGVAAENRPAVLVHQVAKRQETDFLQGHAHQRVESCAIVLFELVRQEPDGFKVTRRHHRQADEVADSFVKPRVGAIAELDRLILVLHELCRVTQTYSWKLWRNLKGLHIGCVPFRGEQSESPRCLPACTF